MTESIPIGKRSGPRSRVFSHLAPIKDNTPGWTTEIVDSNGHPATLPSYPVISKNLPAGDMRLYSYYTPGLLEATSYTATVKHTITIPRDKEPKVLESAKSFTVIGPRWSMDPRLVHSVYPPPAHADYSSILPHIVFNDPHAPWLININAENGLQDLTMKTPWLALLVFTDSEITPSTDQIAAMQKTIKDAGSTTTLNQNPKSKSFGMKLSDLIALDGTLSQPIIANDADTDYNTSVDTILVSSSVFDELFAKYSDPPNMKKIPSTKPDLTCFKYMSHVKNTNFLSDNNDINDVGQFAVTVSPRTGPLSLRNDTTIFVHLVSLENVSQNILLPSGKDHGLTALVSLYSWSYSCIPQEKASVYEAMRALGNNIQPLRVPDSLWTLGSSPEEKWANERLQAGYSLIRYRTGTGEETMAVQRGPLSPLSISSPPKENFPNQSNFGSDLIIVNKEFGVADLTYQLGWHLGRAVAMSDRVFVGALVRLRSEIHEQSLSAAKAEVDKSFVDRKTTLRGLSNIFSTLHGAHTQLHGDRQFDFTQRWKRLPLGYPPRSQLSLKQTSIQQSYAAKVPVLASQRAQSTQGTPYNEFNSPISTDYATVLAWCLDRFFLHGIPCHYLFGDPRAVPKESIRTFYLDENWFDVFLDGALSLGNYYARDTDVIRSSIKAAFNTYLKTNLVNGYPPQIPRWGFVLRSDIVTKISDLIVLAPWTDPKDQRLEVLKIERPDMDLLVCLFDRVPDDGSFPNGITLRPPEHQLSFNLGHDLTSNSLTMRWKKVYADQSIPQDYSEGSIPLPPKTYKAEDNSGVFDFDTSRLVFPHFAKDASTAQSSPSWLGNPTSNVVGPTPALVGAQLVADIPRLFLSTVSSTTPKANFPSVRQLPLAVMTVNTAPGGPTSMSPEHATTMETLVPTNYSLHEETKGSKTPIDTPQGLFGNPGFRKLLMERRRFDLRPLLSEGSTVNLTTPGDLPPQMSCKFVCGGAGLLGPLSASLPDGHSALLPRNPTPSPKNQIPSSVDQGFSIIAQPKEHGWYVEYVEVSIPVGNRPSDLFLPFPTGEEDLYKIVASTAAKPSVTPGTSMTWNWPHKPKLSFSALNVPIVKPFSRGRRYVPEVKYEPESGAPPGCGRMIIRMRPATSAGRWDIKEDYDLSFSVQEPVINWAPKQTYTVDVVEKYHDWPGDETLSGFARSTVVIEAREIT
ncbi:hypothetical protein CIMG_09306 [Paecilomyces variotii No. 5]|uniref:Uncharacterized protein n=1 Tax=Byssochlamys spectabilis (strain No. 5 / NBRC 109023) TaxID=1356009 RepID=V5G6H5_BYSSN|nr:hypothetical protein CIMG_09306 [Paecilomyces variotii No. 5]